MTGKGVTRLAMLVLIALLAAGLTLGALHASSVDAARFEQR